MRALAWLLALSAILGGGALIARGGCCIFAGLVLVVWGALSIQDRLRYELGRWLVP